VAGLSRRTGGGIGDGFSRTGVRGTGGWTCATGGIGLTAISGVGGGAAACITTGLVATSTGFTAKYTIPDASTAPVAKADTSFQSIFAPRPLRLHHLNATRAIYVSDREPLK
jgi:hypothetical protein